MKKEINANGYEYVDFGLPSGTLWATCNLGATKPEEYGLFFQWGDIVGYTGDDAKMYSTWHTTPFNWGMFTCNPDFERLKKLICSKSILRPKYDAVHAHMEGDWKMPTKWHFDELKEYTKQEWITVNGVNGKKITSKKDSTKYIFIPASGGYCSGIGTDDGEWAGLWSSSIYILDSYCAWTLYFDYSGNYNVHTLNRCRGFCVRGVIS